MSLQVCSKPVRLENKFLKKSIGKNSSLVKKNTLKTLVRGWLAAVFKNIFFTSGCLCSVLNHFMLHSLR